ncbi:phage tail protein [Actinokineospora pegani]|uniref:phage tail protein n=1 Tax=Actinokineospora pegani TaxID=2654637 RepID=UPI0012E9DC3F|nr:phage tail protein [Actinokineospora pegani]
MSGQGGNLALGMAMRFNVVIDGVNLGNWTSCKGLDLKCKIHKFYDNGEYGYQKILFADVEYPTVKLERAMEKASSQVLREWLSDKLSAWKQPGFMPDIVNAVLGGSTARITLLDSAWEEVSSWELRNVYPSGWYGPSLVAKDSAVAIERLELDHEGFL